MPTAPVPTRVGAGVKEALLGLVGHATAQGWPTEKACAVLGLDVRRARRWTRRADAGTGWKAALGELALVYPDRINPHL